MRDAKIHLAPHKPGGPPMWSLCGRAVDATGRTQGDGWFPQHGLARCYAESVPARSTRSLKQAERDWPGSIARVGLPNIGPDGDVAREEAARSIGRVVTTSMSEQ